MKLYLASKSYSRKYLLTESQIPFTIVDQHADEAQCDWNLPIDEVVTAIALYKMQHVILPQGQEGEQILILTADTLCQDNYGTIHGKPLDYHDAIKKLKLLRAGARIMTSFCLDKRQLKNDTWQLIDRKRRTVAATCLFIVPDNFIEIYFKKHPIALQAAGALAIEQYGLQFIQSIEGSYSTIIGLPLFELREDLYDMGFFAALK